MTQILDSKRLLQRFYIELFTEGKLTVADEIVSENYKNHNPVPGEAPGREGLKQFVSSLRESFPDLKLTVEDQVVEGDKIATRFLLRGTHRGPFAGIPATGRRIEVSAINIHRVVRAQIAEGWLNWDALGMMQQLGAFPSA